MYTRILNQLTSHNRCTINCKHLAGCILEF